MVNFAFDNAKRALLAGELDFDANTIKALIVMSNTTADTEKDKTTISGFTTLDEMDGSGYARITLTSKAVAVDNSNNRGEFTAADMSFPFLNAGTRAVTGIVVYKHVTDDTDSIPLYYLDTATGVTFPFTPTGGTLTLAPNAEGMVQVT